MCGETNPNPNTVSTILRVPLTPDEARMVVQQLRQLQARELADLALTAGALQHLGPAGEVLSDKLRRRIEQLVDECAKP